MTTSATALSSSIVELQDAAIEISRILRDAKVDAPLRPKAFAALLVAATGGALAPEADAPTRSVAQRIPHPVSPKAGETRVGHPRQAGAHSLSITSGARLESGPSEQILTRINLAVAAALAETTLSDNTRQRLVSTLRLAGPDFERLAPYIPAIATVLERQNLPGLLHSDIDFLGVFYEAFLRYGFDNNALGIVFTPRHITRFCVELIGVGPEDRAIDIACGTGGFLVAAHDAIVTQERHSTETPRHSEEQVIAGFDTNPTVWALAALNMVFRGDGESDIQLRSCFDVESRQRVRRRFTRAFLNPPFSQNAEPERDFIDATMDALTPGGRCAVVVKAGIFADEEHASWRAEFVRHHTVLGVISLPDDVFYPTAAPSSILLAEAHVPQPARSPVLMAHVWNDGFEKLKNRRVPRSGAELPEVGRCFQALLAGKEFSSPLAATVHGEQLQDSAEWSPQEWLPQPSAAPDETKRGQQEVVASIFRAVAQIPDLADVVLEDFADGWAELPDLPSGQSAMLREFFHVLNGRSAGEKRFPEGTLPYVSSGDTTNSVVRLVDADPGEVFPNGGITVTAFSHATVQPWPFVARGNGGSAVRVLIPRFRMSISELTWFAAQINAQRWRFFYARMAIQSRMERLTVVSPAQALPQPSVSIAAKVREFRAKLAELSEL